MIPSQREILLCSDGSQCKEKSVQGVMDPTPDKIEWGKRDNKG